MRMTQRRLELLDRAIAHYEASLDELYDTEKEQEKVAAELEQLWQLILEKFRPHP